MLKFITSIIASLLCAGSIIPYKVEPGGNNVANEADIFSESKDICQNDNDCWKIMENSYCKIDWRGNNCICQSSYVSTPAGCLPDATVGSSCKYSQQCPTGSDCNNGTCSCFDGHAKREDTCIETYIARSCTKPFECPARSVCTNGKCICRRDYVRRGYRCVRRRIDYCNDNSDCQKHGEMSFCHVDVTGNKCQCPPSYVISPTECLPKANLGSNCKDKLQCPAGGDCSDRGTCVCKEGYVSKKDECVIKMKDECHKDSDCNKYMENATCIIDIAGNHCQCPRGYIISTSECLPKVNLGDFCKLSDQCPVASVCLIDTCVCRNDSIREGMECIKPKFGSCSESLKCAAEYSVCSNGSCVCSEGYAKKEDQCVGRRYDECYNDNDCREFLNNSICLIEAGGNTCDCPQGYSYGYNDECLKNTILGGSCSESMQCPKSVSECRNNTCVCRKQYVRKGSECVTREIGSPCEDRTYCPILTNCTDGVCTCFEHYVNKGKKCVSSILGDSCRWTTECPRRSSCDNDTNTCVCQDGYIRITDSCIKEYVGDTCEGNYDCPLFSFCEDNICVCKKNYVIKDSKCVYESEDVNVLIYILPGIAVVVAIVILVAVFIRYRLRRSSH